MDLIDAHIKAIDYLNNSGSSSIFNCGYGHGFSVLEVIEAIKKVSGNDFQVKIEKRRLGDPESLISNNVKIKRELNWVPKFDDIIKIVSDEFIAFSFICTGFIFVFYYLECFSYYRQ